MTELNSRWLTLRKNIQAHSSDVSKKQGARDQLLKSKKAEEGQAEQFKLDQKLAEQAHLFLISEIIDRRQKAIAAIESMGTSALRLVYGPDYKLRFNTFDEKREEGSAGGFKMEIQVESQLKGKELVTGLLGERGGGVVETVAFALRMAALEWMGYEGPMAMDEAYKSISNDAKLEAVARFLRYIADQTGRQIIFATHKADVFGKIADNIIHVTSESGVAKATNLTYDELMGKMEVERLEALSRNMVLATDNEIETANRLGARVTKMSTEDLQAIDKMKTRKGKKNATN